MKTGLSSFAASFNACKSVADERALARSELLRARQFLQQIFQTQQKTRDSPEQILQRLPIRKIAKVLWRLVFLQTLGYDASFGRTAAAFLLHAESGSAKFAAYSALSVFPSPLVLHERLSEAQQRQLQQSLSQCVSAVKLDLMATDPVIQGLALQHVWSICSPQNSRELFLAIQTTANPASRSCSSSRQRAYVALLRLHCLSPQALATDVWAYRLTQSLMIEKHPDVVLALSHLLLGLLQQRRRSRPERRSPSEICGSRKGEEENFEERESGDCSSWEAVRSSLLHCLARVLWGEDELQQEAPPPHPFLLTRLLQLLQELPPPATASETQTANQTLRLCFERLLHASVVREEESHRRKWGFSRKLHSLPHPRGAVIGESRESVPLRSAGSAKWSSRLRSLSSLPSFSLPRRAIKAASSFGSTGSEARAQLGPSASSGIQLQQGAFELPPLQAAVVLEAAKAAFCLKHAAAADLLEKASDVIFFLVADERADVRVTAVNAALDIIQRLKIVSPFRPLTAAALSLVQGSDAVTQQQPKAKKLTAACDATPQALRLVEVLTESSSCMRVLETLANAAEKQKQLQRPTHQLLAAAARIAENFADTEAHVAFAFRLAEIGGSYSPECIWSSAAARLLRDTSVVPQRQAVYLSLEKLRAREVEEPVLCLGGFILGEFLGTSLGGRQQELAAEESIALIQKHLERRCGPGCLSSRSLSVAMLSLEENMASVGRETTAANDSACNGVLLLALAKIAATFQQFRPQVLRLLRVWSSSADFSVQTRAAELTRLLEAGGAELTPSALSKGRLSGKGDQGVLPNSTSIQSTSRKSDTLSSEASSSSQSGGGAEETDSQSESDSSRGEGSECSSEGESDSAAAAFEELSKYLEGALPSSSSGSSTLGNTDALWTRACALPEGKLLETPLLQLSYRRESLRGGGCRLVLSWRNPSSTSLLKIDVQPFAGSPLVDVAAISGDSLRPSTSCMYTTSLPVALVHFFVPLDLAGSAEKFRQGWSRMQQRQKDLECYCALPSRRAVALLLQHSLSMHTLTLEGSLAGAALLTTDAPHPVIKNRPLTVPVLCRLTANPNRHLRVVIATTHPLVHQQFESMLRMLLAVGDRYQAVQQPVLQAQQQTFGLAASGVSMPASRSFYPSSGQTAQSSWQQHVQQVPQATASDARVSTCNQTRPPPNNQNMHFSSTSGGKMQGGALGQGLGQPLPTQYLQPQPRINENGTGPRYPFAS